MTSTEKLEEVSTIEQDKPTEGFEDLDINNKEHFQYYRDEILDNIKGEAKEVKEDGVVRLDRVSHSHDLPEEQVAFIREERQVDAQLQLNSNEIDELTQNTTEQIGRVGESGDLKQVVEGFQENKPIDNLEPKVISELGTSEVEIIQQLNSKDVDILRKLNLDNLNREKDKIIGFRSEDLFFLLQSIHSGYLDTSGDGVVMGKSDQHHFYLTENPEAEYFIGRNDLQKYFKESSSRNINLYSKIAMKMALKRNLLGLMTVQEQSEFIRSAIEKFDYMTEDPTAFEDYFDNVIEDINTNPNIIEFKSKSRPHLNFLYEGVRGHLTSPKQFDSFLRNLNLRRGVIISFSNDLVLDYGDVSSQADGQNELVLDVPDGKIDLKYIVGFESLGDFEDNLIEQLIR